MNELWIVESVTAYQGHEAETTRIFLHEKDALVWRKENPNTREHCGCCYFESLPPKKYIFVEAVGQFIAEWEVDLAK